MWKGLRPLARPTQNQALTKYTPPGFFVLFLILIEKYYVQASPIVHWETCFFACRQNGFKSDYISWWWYINSDSSVWALSSY